MCRFVPTPAVVSVVWNTSSVITAPIRAVKGCWEGPGPSDWVRAPWTWSTASSKEISQEGSDMSSNKKGPADFRSSETGRFVTERFAETHPRTTQKEHNRPSSPPTKKK